MRRMHVNDSKWDKKLNIITGAADYEKDDANHSRYEPTSYAVLERLAASGYVRRDDVLVDYGCGKGRVGFYMNSAVGCKAIGVEYNEALLRQAEENRRSYAGGNSVSFVYLSAEEYDAAQASCFYFFNPFSVKILQAVIGRIFEAYYDDPRPMRLFFYYALDPYLSLLMTDARLRFAGEIDCRDLFHNDDFREKILVFDIE